MSKHDELLDEGPRTAPEPETAEQRSRIRKRGLLGGLLGGGAVALKLGAFTKLFIWLAVWHGGMALVRLAGWPGLVLVVVAVAATAVVLVRARNERRASAKPAEGLVS